MSVALAVLTLVGALSSSLRSRASAWSVSLRLLVLALYLQLSFLSLTSIGVHVSSFYAYPPTQYSLLFGPKVHSAVQAVAGHRHVQALHVSSSYGLFRQMTGMGEARGAGQRGVGGAPPSVVARYDLKT